MGLDAIVGHAFFWLTRNGTAGQAETDGELGKYRQDALYFARTLARFFRHNGRDLLAYLGKRPDEYLAKRFKGTGAVRFQQRGSRVIAATYMNLGIIVGNSYGGGFSEGIDVFAAANGLSCRESKEYVLYHETVHFAGVHSESEVENHLYHYFMDRAKRSKTTQAQQKYLFFAQVALHRYHIYEHAESGHKNGGHKHITAKGNPNSKQRQQMRPANGRAPQKQYSSQQRAAQPTAAPKYQQRPAAKYATPYSPQKSPAQNYRKAT